MEGLSLVVMALVEKGADVNVKDNDGHTPLHRACMTGLTEVAIVMLQKGAEINV
jgi:ankyrin repeat protein